MTVSPRTVDVGGGAPYRITIGPGLLDDGDLLATTLRGRHALIVSDANVAPLYADRLEGALHRAKPNLHIARHVVAAGEAGKTLANFGTVIEALARLGATRDATVIALGGGVVGDMAGFAAACWCSALPCCWRCTCCRRAAGAQAAAEALQTPKSRGGTLQIFRMMKNRFFAYKTGASSSLIDTSIPHQMVIACFLSQGAV